MIDPSPVPSPPWTFKGHGWVFLLSPQFTSTLSSSALVDHPDTDGHGLCGHGSLTLYRYTSSPFGPYDELSFSPGWYPYLSPPSTSPYRASRVTKSYVSCNAKGIGHLRQDLGIPVEPAEFAWYSPPGSGGDIIVVISRPDGQHVLELLISQSSLSRFTINSKSIISDSIDLGRLGCIVQPLLDGHTVGVPRELEYTPLLERAPLLKSWSSVKGEGGLVRIKKAVSNAALFPRIEDIGVSRWGVWLTDMEMVVHSPEIVLDVPPCSRDRRRLRSCMRLLNWINGLIFEKVRN
jgi:hypothetical protein